MESLVYNKESLAWRYQEDDQSIQQKKIDVGFYTNSLDLDQREGSCYLIVNYTLPCIEFCCEKVSSLLGFRTKHITLSHLLRLIHPDDAAKYIPEQFRIVQMLKQLPDHKRRKFKISRTLRMKHSNGEYIQVLQEVLAIHTPLADGMLRVFVGLSKASDEECFQGFRVEEMLISAEKHDTLSGKSDNQTSDVLTSRELEVLKLIRDNKSTKEIAEMLSRSPHTVKNHRKNMLRKTGTSNSLELVMLAVQNKWI